MKFSHFISSLPEIGSDIPVPINKKYIPNEFIWVLQNHIPKIGMEKSFKSIENEFIQLTQNLKISSPEKFKRETLLRAEFASISKTPKEIDPSFTKKKGIIDGAKVYACKFLPVHLRARATIDQTAIEAVDYGEKLLFSLKLNNFSSEENYKFIKETANWLIKWGSQGFGYFILK